MAKQKVAILISGGVDSSVALAMLAETEKYELHAFYLKIWLEDELSFLGECPWKEDLDYVTQVCAQFDVPLEIIPLQGAYQEKVVSYTIEELKAGRTPSPDIFCNQRIKFGAFLDHIGDAYDLVATGHYAITESSESGTRLRRGVDPVKDQTYFLSHLSQKQLDRCFFPVGELPKAEVRKLAESFGLPNKDRKDSQGICFLGKIPYNQFVEFHLGQKPGPIIDADSGKVLGSHNGYWFHTRGQRKGLGLGGGPWYVSGKDLEQNIVYVKHASKVSGTSPRVFDLISPNWFDGQLQDGQYSVKVRHGAATYLAQINKTDEAEWQVELDEPDKGLSPGQFAVVYQGDRCLGGAMIENPRGAANH